MHPVKLIIREIQTHGHRPHHMDGFRGIIDNPCRTGNHIGFRQDAVEQFKLHPRVFIFHFNNQRFSLGFIPVKCRKPLKAVLPLFYTVGMITIIHRAASVGIYNLYAVGTIIADAEAGVFLWKIVQRKCPVCLHFIRVSAEPAIGTLNQIGQVAVVNALSIIKVKEYAVISYLHLIGRVFCL